MKSRTRGWGGFWGSASEMSTSKNVVDLTGGSPRQNCSPPVLLPLLSLLPFNTLDYF